LFADLRDRQPGQCRIAAAFLGQPGMGIVDGALATLDRDIHQRASTRVDRGKAAMHSPPGKIVSKPSGNIARLARKAAVSGRFSQAAVSIPGPVRAGPWFTSRSVSTISVAERSG